MSTFNPHFPNAPAVFKAAAEFKNRCLLDQRGLLTDRPNVWTPEHFETLLTQYVRRPDAGEGGFYQKLSRQLSQCSPTDVALMAELFWLVQLPVNNLAAAYKRERIEWVWDANPLGAFPSDSPFLSTDVLSGLGSGGTGYNLYLWMEVSFAINAFADLAAKTWEDRQDILSDAWTFADWLDSIPSGKGRQLYHALCHVFFPAQFERIFSHSQKTKVARAQGIWTSEYRSSRPAMDKGLLEVRRRLEAERPEGVDYYLEPFGFLIPPPKKETKAAIQPDEPAPITGSDVDDAIEPSAAPRRFVPENVVLFGPPGTGKTYELEMQRRKVFNDGGESLFVTFHPSYAYEDFLGGLRPMAAEDGNGIVVKFVKGPFLQLCEKAHQSPNVPHVLFIDEINRANVAKVFGELITLIEPSKRVVPGSTPNDTGTWVTVPGLDAPLGVPHNLNIVATMNSADRSIAMMDIAMRRRFRWQECAPQSELIEPAMVDNVDLRRLLDTINDRVEYLLDRDHRIGHALLIGVHSLADLIETISERIIPLLQEYFFDDLERVRLALTGKTGDSPFFVTRKLLPGALFSTNARVGSESRNTFAVTDPTGWTESDIVALYSSAGPEAA